LLGKLGAVRAAAVTYLIPLFGLLWAWLFLAEVPTPSMLIAALLILGGVGLSQLERNAPVTK
jgi:drug/metabolite transporter (DMT)-like permease